jgi:hypothetical protein
MTLKDIIAGTELYTQPTDLNVDQIKAADNVLSAIQNLKSKNLFPRNLKAVEETDVFRLRRGLCLPAASATSINHVLGFRLIGDEKGYLTLGDMYTSLLPFHGYKDGKETENMPKGWLVTTDQGDVYHHAIVAFSKALRVPSKPVIGFKSVRDFDSNLKEGDSIALSLDNTFVLEQTLKSNTTLVKTEGNQTSILIESEEGTGFRKFEHGRHVVAVTASSTEGFYKVSDSFRLPQMRPEDTLSILDSDTIDKYLNYTLGGQPRGILFSKDEGVLNQHPNAIDVVIPNSIVDNIRAYLDSKLGFS